MNKNFNIKNILIVGLGLVGGSYAKALKKLGYTVYAIDTDNGALDFALANKIIDYACGYGYGYGYDYVNPKSAICNCQMIILCLYPHACVEWVQANAKYFKDDVLITDVCGVKHGIAEDITDFIAKIKKNAEFIPSHPMAGREVSGVQNSDDSIFKNANFIITPTKANTVEAIEFMNNFAKKIGFGNVSILSTVEHDEMIGYVSQLTHAIAVALMLAEDNPNLSKYTGDSFRDLTRIAKINENLWCELFLSNKMALTAEIDNFITTLTTIKDKIESDDAVGLKNILIKSAQRRKSFD